MIPQSVSKLPSTELAQILVVPTITAQRSGHHTVFFFSNSMVRMVMNPPSLGPMMWDIISDKVLQSLRACFRLQPSGPAR